MDLERFLKAQDSGGTYHQAVRELRNGRKTSHWMWFIFPQIAGLGRSAMAQAFAISDLAEAQAYLEQVKANGLAAYVTEADVDGKTFFRVRVGKYSSVDAASDAKVDIDKTTKKSASIVKVN